MCSCSRLQESGGVFEDKVFQQKFELKMKANYHFMLN